MYWHLAQVNVARAVAPLSDARMPDFVAQIGEVNAAAEAAPGFVWRDKVGEPPPERADPCLLYNLSVWESIETLRAYVYQGRHVEPFRARARWFLPWTGPRLALCRLALWWISAGHFPDSRESFERLDYLAEHGPTAAAFSFEQPSIAPEEPAGDPSERPCVIDYDGRELRAITNTANGDVTPGVKFFYRGHGRRVWATYAGLGMRFGALVAHAGADGVLDACYQHFTSAGERSAGRCRSVPERLADGRSRLHEAWQWTTGDRSSGKSLVEEAAGGES